jgi:hypothetical protein
MSRGKVSGRSANFREALGRDVSGRYFGSRFELSGSVGHQVAACRGDMSCDEVLGHVANLWEASGQDVSGRHVAWQSVGSRCEFSGSVGS